jgi:hypothetical protein
MKRVIHINQHVIKNNAKKGLREPAITVKTYKDNEYAHAVEILGPSKVIYNPGKPLRCGAKCWIETESDVVLDQIGFSWYPSPYGEGEVNE